MELIYSSAIQAGVFVDGEAAGTNRIDRFQRVPSDLRKYLEYTAQIKAEYGSVMRFVVKERLRWGDGDSPEDLKPRGRPFEFDGMQLAFLCGKFCADPALRGYPDPVQ